MNRDQFDQLPKIVQAMAEHPIFYDECKNIYKTLSSNVGDCYATMFVQGAWYTWQEQQKVIDVLRDATKVMLWHRDEILNICNDDGLMNETMIEKIEELLK